jgi:hypothetical protein
VLVAAGDSVPARKLLVEFASVDATSGATRTPRPSSGRRDERPEQA